MQARKWMFVLVAVFVGIAVCITNSYAYEYKETSAAGKLTRGVTNVVTSPVEIVRNVYVESQYENVAYGMTIGLGKGVFKTILRLGAGVVETLTFPFNFPDEFKDPIIEPEYVWEEW
jgi:putative exosortase-associated protein (TIGR04073 family)